MKKTRTLLLALLLPAVSLPATAAYDALRPQEIIKVDSGETLRATDAGFSVDLTRLNTGVKTDDRTAIMKDGQGTFVLDKDTDMHCSLVVREGTMVIGGGESKVSVTNNPNLESPVITVGGLNAELVLDNAAVTNVAGKKIDSINGEPFVTEIYNNGQKKWQTSDFYTTSYVSAVCVGGRDGDGTLTLKNGSSLTFAQSVFSGTVSYAGTLSDNTTNAHVCGSYRDAAGTELYREQAIADGAFSETWQGSTGSKLSHATINVLSGSQLNTGIGFYAGNTVVNIDGKGSVLNSGVRSSVSDDTMLGFVGGATTYINITNGGVMNVGAQKDEEGQLTSYQYLWAGYYDNTHVCVDIAGNGSKLNVNGPAMLAWGKNANASADVILRNGASMYAGEIDMGRQGSRSSINITGGAYLETPELIMALNSTIMTDADSFICVDRTSLGNGATLINHGLIMGCDTFAATISLGDGSRFQTGEVTISGREENASVGGSLALDYATGMYWTTVKAEQGEVTIGALLTGDKQMQYLKFSDMASINAAVRDGLNLSEGGDYTISYKHEIGKNIAVNYTTDHLNNTNGTENIAVNGGAILVEQGQGEHHVGTIGSYVEHAGETAASVAVGETASGSSVMWQGDGMTTVAGENTKLIRGTHVSIGNDESVGTLTVVANSTLDNQGVIAANTLVEAGGTLKGSGSMGSATVQGTLVVGNSPGAPVFEDLLLGSTSETVFSIAGAAPATSELSGWENAVYSQITITDGTLTLNEGARFVIEFGGALLYDVGGHQDFTIDLDLVNAADAITLGGDELDTLLGNTTFRIAADSPTGGADWSVNVDFSQSAYSLTNDDTTLHLHLAAHLVPEPATTSLSLMALAALVSRRKRR